VIFRIAGKYAKKNGFHREFYASIKTACSVCREVLGVTGNDGKKEIKTRRQYFSKIFHPDIYNSKPSQEKKEINDLANSLLSKYKPDLKSKNPTEDVLKMLNEMADILEIALDPTKRLPNDPYTRFSGGSGYYSPPRPPQQPPRRPSQQPPRQQQRQQPPPPPPPPPPKTKEEIRKDLMKEMTETLINLVKDSWNYLSNDEMYELVTLKLYKFMKNYGFTFLSENYVPTNKQENREKYYKAVKKLINDINKSDMENSYIQGMVDQIWSTIGSKIEEMLLNRTTESI